MAEQKIQGIFPPMITPFTADGEIYEKGLREVAEFLISKGVTGSSRSGRTGASRL